MRWSFLRYLSTILANASSSLDSGIFLFRFLDDFIPVPLAKERVCSNLFSFLDEMSFEWSRLRFCLRESPSTESEIWTWHFRFPSVGSLKVTAICASFVLLLATFFFGIELETKLLLRSLRRNLFALHFIFHFCLFDIGLWDSRSPTTPLIMSLPLKVGLI